MSTKFNPEYTPQMSITLLVAFTLAISLIFSDIGRADSPRFLNCPESTLELNHCRPLFYFFRSNVGGPRNLQNLEYSIAETNVEGEARIQPSLGALGYNPSIMDVQELKYISVQVCHTSSGKCDTCTIYLDVTNSKPILWIADEVYRVEVGDTLRVFPVVGQDYDYCDVLTYGLTPGSPGTIDPANSMYTWTPTVDDVGMNNICVSMTDGLETAEGCFLVEVVQTRPYEVQIETRTDVLQGHFIDVDVTLNKGSEPMGGFDFLIGYNTAALTFTEAQFSQQLVDCGWEYFTYRYSWNGNCGDSCPSGLLRFVGLAETNNGPYHPDFECIRNVRDLFTMTFFVTNDRTWQCRFVPIQFYWVDCGDNAIVTPSGDTLAVNRHITDFHGNYIEDYEQGFPGVVGVPDDPCLEGDPYGTIRFADFINGGVEIICQGPIDARGDINVNGVSHEIADWVMFINYFLQGIYAFGYHVEASIAASDVNCDGTSLRLEDFMKLAQVIVGNDVPCEGTVVPDTITVDFTLDNQMNVFYVGSPYYKLSAVYTVFMGEIIPTLDLDMPNLNLGYTHDSGITRIIVYPDPVSDPPEFNMCRLFSYMGNGELMEIQAADLYNHVVVTDSYSDADDETDAALPSDYSLLQNHPNPFNPSTEIRFALPRVSSVTLEIFNVLGRRVATLVEKRLPAGEHVVEWDGCDIDGKRVASAIYIYRLTAGEYSSSRQMILSK